MRISFAKQSIILAIYKYYRLQNPILETNIQFQVKSDYKIVYALKIFWN